MTYVTAPKRAFRARLPPNFNTCHKIPRLPRNLHLVATSRSRANAILTKHTTKITYFAAFPIGTATFCHHEHAPVTGPRATKCHACHAKRSYITLDMPRRSPEDGCKRLQTGANGCRRLQTVANIKTASSEHTSTHRPPKCKSGTFRYAFGKNTSHRNASLGQRVTQLAQYRFTLIHCSNETCNCNDDAVCTAAVRLEHSAVTASH